MQSSTPIRTVLAAASAVTSARDVRRVGTGKLRELGDLAEHFSQHRRRRNYHQGIQPRDRRATSASRISRRRNRAARSTTISSSSKRSRCRAGRCAPTARGAPSTAAARARPRCGSSSRTVFPAALLDSTEVGHRIAADDWPQSPACVICSTRLFYFPAQLSWRCAGTRRSTCSACGLRATGRTPGRS